MGCLCSGQIELTRITRKQQDLGKYVNRPQIVLNRVHTVYMSTVDM
jgi:hypothetical protein